MEVPNENELFIPMAEDLITVLNKYIKEPNGMDIRDFLAAVAVIFIDVVRMAETADPENIELNRYRAISYISQLIFNEEFRNYRKASLH